VILVFIATWYTVLTWRMARAVSRQTRAMIQPVALLSFHWLGNAFTPIGIPPGESLCPEFDFEKWFVKENLQWDPMQLSYSLVVVTSDLSKQVILTYSNIPVLGISNVHMGMPLSVRWRYFVWPFKQRYFRILYRFRPPKIG
jgi:hypothetical protein